ncbi:FAD-linked oxidase [Marinomonas sp. SBI22]|uniref:D-2-hydroxyglutarate dehydrogenase YdiJ n=1 Tax=unclassified Marinomonas TaxID=196814 RepID=UPI0007AFB26E|nr:MULTISPECIES: FAD-binding and (Fe-S)-binding domain-containing protein [unclassified Marinomonas]KZM43659.1 FAD-linked oxidase [Marinomonas sp. SBI22]KZM47221.1 FAD-linked oxidase [Marinomonas sp. SBI8L]
MIPKLSDITPTQSLYLSFIERLKADGFSGDTNPDYANRVVLATDNSIYQVLPQGVIYPKSVADIQLLTRLAHLEEFQSIVLSPRGGGTGTNGQSLTDGLIVDLSKHMNQVLEINAEEGWARVQTGVVKDQLNAAVKEHGLFFAPELSTSNRATVGGMINTDASGQGSVMYGKTRDHVLSLDTVLLDGTLISSGPISDEKLAKEKQREDYAGHIHRVVDDAFNHNQAKIDEIFPELNRCLTGYDLAHIRDENKAFNLNSVLCGSEGTLGFIVEAKVNLLKIPTFATLVNIRYDSFEGSLRHAKELLNAAPTSIETVDSRVLGLAKDDIIWHSVADFFPENEGEDIQGVNLVEYTGNDQTEVDNRIKVLTDLLDTALGEPNSKILGYTLAQGHENVKKIWAMRKKSVGLLGNAKGEGRPIPFVEDTAVPPENLADFIMEFRAVLDAHDLSYGMFGHVDAGVLHVRPAIDMKDEKNEGLIRDITDKVVALTQKYDGLLWGEHGKGVRSEYATEFFGELYPVIQQVKGAFDPHNQLNPGKIATPFELGVELLKIDEVPMRGQFDRQIPLVNRDQFQAGMYCNGNGACYNFDPNDAMCPSYKGTRERIHSPKGRASLMREWLRGMSEQGVDTQAVSDKIKETNFISSFFPRLNNTLKKRRGDYDFSNEVHESMMGCLACKSCVGQCPIKVDVPEFRAKFLEIYYSRYLRPVKDYVVGSMEYIMPTLAKYPNPYNWMMEQAWINRLSANYLGITDSPTLSKLNIKKEMNKRGIRFATPMALDSINPYERHKAVIIVQDAFTSYFETQLVLDTMELLTRLGFQAFLAPYKPNGKPLHVHGFFKAFEKAANKNLDMLEELAAYKIPFVGVDPSMTLSFRSEYPKVIGDKREIPTVNLLQEWLVGKKDHLSTQPFALEDEVYHLLAHCTEKTNAAASIQDWVKVFSLVGLSLKVENVGCCGMAGTYGHETANLQTSKDIYELSWKDKINDETLQDRIVATGYSCRSQVKRFDQKEVLHPLQALLKHLKEAAQV